MTREQASSRVPFGEGAFRPGAAAGAALVLGLLGARGSAARSSRTESVGCVVRGRSGRGRRRFRSSRVSRARMRSCAARPRLEPAPWLCLPFLRPMTTVTNHVCAHVWYYCDESRLRPRLRHLGLLRLSQHCWLDRPRPPEILERSCTWSTAWPCEPLYRAPHGHNYSRSLVAGLCLCLLVPYIR